MIVEKSLSGPYTRIQEVQERFLKNSESARDLANYYVCRHNLYMALAVHETNPKAKQRMKNKARNSMFALEEFRLVEQARLEINIMRWSADFLDFLVKIRLKKWFI